MYKRGQLTIFVIIAILIVSGIAGYFLLREEVEKQEIPQEFRPVEEKFLSCLNREAEAGKSILGERGGYIYPPDFVPGSDYMPTSNYLDFLGSPVPYWYYVSGNNIQKEQVPTKREMEEQLERFLEENLECDFSEFRDRGYEVVLENGEAEVNIYNNKISVGINSELSISFGGESAIVKEHSVDVSSNLGEFYNTAREIYKKEREEAFIEEYSLDTLYLNAPVTGVDLSCSPKIWVKDEIDRELKEALEGNIIMIRGSSSNNYFKVSGVDKNVQFLYSKEWPTKIEISPDNEVLLAEPVGNQQGMGILGFCYVPYHFVYDVVHPVLIQVYNNEEIFQFPVLSIIENNKPREGLGGEVIEEEEELCKYKNNKIKVYTYDTNLMPVEARVSFKCLDEKCYIGKTEVRNGEAVLEGNFPRCVNGFLIVEAEGFEVGRKQVSTNRESGVDIILDKLYSVNVSLNVGGKEVGDKGIVYFYSNDTSKTLIWPDRKNLELSEGSYNVRVNIYKNSSIYIPETSTQRCVEVARPGLLGVFGGREEECFSIEIPGQKVSNVLSGGGNTNQYITESELRRGKLIINAERVPVPKNFEDLQVSYSDLENKNVYLEFENE